MALWQLLAIALFDPLWHKGSNNEMVKEVFFLKQQH